MSHSCPCMPGQCDMTTPPIEFVRIHYALPRMCWVWGQERSSTSKWRRYGSRTDERTCTWLEIVRVLGEVEEIGIHASPPPPHTQKKRQVNGQEKQGYQQENKGMNKRTTTSFYVCVLPHFSRLISPLSSVHWQVYFSFCWPFCSCHDDGDEDDALIFP
jgi:hypothetical protein